MAGERLRNDGAHLASLVLLVVCASSTVMFLATTWASFAARSFQRELAEKATAQGTVPPDIGVGSLHLWAIFTAVVAISSGLCALVMWRSARSKARQLDPE